MKPARPLTLDWNRTKRLREGLRWVASKPPRRRISDMAKVGLLLVILSILLPMLVALLQQLSETRSDLDRQRKVTQKYVAMLASAMNGRALIDKASGTAYFFDKPYVVPFGVSR